MSVGRIIQRVGNKMGLNPSDTEQRAVMLRFLNEAAQELYTQSDMVGTMMEECFKVNGDQTITLPDHVGQIRAVRETDTGIPWKLNQMRPRYNVSNWPDMWRNYRIKGKVALQNTITNEAQVVVTVAAVEIPNVVITITGSTEDAASITEIVTMDAVSKTTTNNFTNITAALKDRVNGYNVTLSDVDGNSLTVIPNNKVESSYLCIDVSTLPWSNSDAGQTEHYVEILYKKTLSWLQNDGDEFPAQGYDNVLVNKCLQLWAEEQGKGDEAMAYDNKATRSLARIQEDENRGTEDCVSFSPNPHDGLLAPIRQGHPSRYNRFINFQ